MRRSILNHASRREHGQHPGLILSRFLTVPADGSSDAADERRTLFRAVREASRSRGLLELYTLAYNRWRDALPRADDASTDAVLKTAGRLVVGLGSESVLETGLRLHHTYGVPILPASALKGLTSHYCDHVWGQRHRDDAPPENRLFRRHETHHSLLFGTTEDGGVIGFEDGWLLPDSLTAQREGLVPDVMTPHHPDWQTKPDCPPTDFDNPVPVTYLSVAGRFHVAVRWQGPDHVDAPRWAGLVFSLLREALSDWGIGGKTSSGYGRLVEAQALPGEATKSRTETEQGKRPAGTPVKVRIVASRAKGGFDVQEQGRAPGTLTLGSAPPGIGTEAGAEVDVFVHNDDPRRPQYKWPDPTRGGKK